MLRRHRGFTLIELLVVMALIIVLLSLAVAFNNSATMDSYKVVGAGDRLAQALITAKSRAARDRAPRGIRLVADSRGFIQELYYIEQPEPWLPDARESVGTNGLPVESHRSQLALLYKSQQPYPPPSPVLPPLPPQPPGQPVRPAGYNYPKPDPLACSVYLVLTASDYTRFVQMFASGELHIVSSPDVSAAFVFSSYTDETSVPANTLVYGSDVALGMKVLKLGVTRVLNPDLACGESYNPQLIVPASQVWSATTQTRNFGIYLPAKPLAGEPSLTLSKTAAVDTTASLPHFTPYMQAPTTRYPNTLRSGESIDILFSPSGHVMYYAEGVLAFLIRDIQRSALLDATPVNNNRLTDPTVGQRNYSNAGEMILVAVFPRTGTVVTKPVAEPRGANPDPYQYAKDAINSGL